MWWFVLVWLWHKCCPHRTGAFALNMGGGGSLINQAPFEGRLLLIQAL